MSPLAGLKKEGGDIDPRLAPWANVVSSCRAEDAGETPAIHSRGGCSTRGDAQPRRLFYTRRCTAEAAVLHGAGHGQAESLDHATLEDGPSRRLWYTLLTLPGGLNWGEILIKLLTLVFECSLMGRVGVSGFFW